MLRITRDFRVEVAVKLVPKFSEHHVETFFYLFVRR